jgi:hypothetical protein
MFRVFLGMEMSGLNIQPHELCIQAAQSILALAQSYDDLFTLHRVSGLMPYFICASGLFGLAVEDAGLVMEPVHLRAGISSSSQLQPEPKDSSSVDGTEPAPDTARHVKMSAAAHARLLLNKMSSNYPMLLVAGNILEEAVLSREQAGAA